jgi:hypothetical protein
MPRFNGTGPEGQGPETGQGLGPCGGGRGLKRGFGCGFGFRRILNSSEEKEYLEQEAKNLEERSKQINNRLKELKDQK